MCHYQYDWNCINYECTQKQYRYKINLIEIKGNVDG